MILRINCMGRDCLFSVSKEGLYLGVCPKSLTGGAIHVTAYTSTPPPCIICNAIHVVDTRQ